MQDEELEESGNAPEEDLVESQQEEAVENAEEGENEPEDVHDAEEVEEDEEPDQYSDV